MAAPNVEVGAAPDERWHRCTTVKRRRRKPGECATPVTAIRNFCLECCGYQSAEVRRCSGPQCWLYPYRMGKSPLRQKGAALISSGKGAVG